MATVQAALTVGATVHDAEQLWYDTSRWAAWVDGLETVLAVEGDWPSPGATVVWESGPAGRGRVTERVVEYEALRGQTVEVQDGQITGRQAVTFTPVEGGSEVVLSLDYRIRRRSLLTPIVDALFVRNAWTSSLRSTLARFTLELEAGESP
jgi:uncharacterized membrane protein